MKQFTSDDLNVVYEDNQVIVVVKPQGIPSQEDSTGDMDMLRIVKEYLIKKYNKPGDAYVGMFQRLDRPTGGVMAFAKTSKAAKRLNIAKDIGDIEKTYFCIVVGKPRENQGVLDNYLLKNELSNQVQVVPMATEGAKRALLKYTVLNTIEGNSLVKVDLLTGRSHQIRVQFANIGCPILGDFKYGKNEKVVKMPLALWATDLKFTHPVSKERMGFRVFPPKDEMPWKPFNVAMYLTMANFGDPYAITQLANQDLGINVKYSNRIKNPNK